MTAPPSTTACKCAAWPIASTLELQNQAYGATDRRRVRVVKYRGVPFRSGTHDYKIAEAAWSCIPAWWRPTRRRDGNHHRLSSGIAELDA
jgi:circadian clock protein KaiC